MLNRSAQDHGWCAGVRKSDRNQIVLLPLQIQASLHQKLMNQSSEQNDLR